MDTEKAAKYWDKQHFAPEFLRGEWSFHPLAKARLHRILDCECREEWFWRHFLNGKTNLRALGVGVGCAETELRLLTTDTIANYDLYDVASIALENAQATAFKLGISDRARFFHKDIHAEEFQDGSYDLITFIVSLHHITHLEQTLEKCYRALAPGGFYGRPNT